MRRAPGVVSVANAHGFAVAPGPAKITCNAACLQKLGFSGAVVVRDLWQHSTQPGSTAAVSVVVPGNGASVTYKLTAA